MKTISYTDKAALAKVDEQADFYGAEDEESFRFLSVNEAVESYINEVGRPDHDLTTTRPRSASWQRSAKTRRGSGRPGT